MDNDKRCKRITERPVHDMPEMKYLVNPVEEEYPREQQGLSFGR